MVTCWPCFPLKFRSDLDNAYRRDLITTPFGQRMSYMDDCFAGAPQDFLVCITIHKAIEVGVSTGDLYVRISMEKMTKSTRSYPNTENPFFNEYFVFEFHCTLAELLRLTILFEMKKHMTYKKNVVVSELMVDLHSVWNQVNHGYFKKWGRLEAPIEDNPTQEAAVTTYGYLQLDIAIVSQHSAVVNSGLRPEKQDTQTMNKYAVDHDFDDVEKNLMTNATSMAPSNIRYFIAFYRGYFIRQSSYMIQYRFYPFKGKTPVAKSTTTPVWNHEIYFAWMYPSVAQRLLILILAHENLQWKCVAEFELSLEEIAFKGIPSLGPTYIHLYDPINPMMYVGRVLIELRSEMLVEAQPSHVLSSKTLVGLDESRYWHDEVYLVEFLPLMGQHIQTSENEYKISAWLAEHSSNVLKGQLRTPSGRFISALHSKSFRRQTPFRSCMFRVRLPDNRAKYESDFFMLGVINFMHSELDIFKIFQIKYPLQEEEQAKCLRAILGKILTRIKEGLDAHRFDHEVKPQRTTWDINRQLYLLDYFVKLPQKLHQLRQRLRSCYLEHLAPTMADVVSELQRLVAEISALCNMARLQDEWPELVLSLSAGGKELGRCRLNAKLFLHLQQQDLPQQQETLSWRLRSFPFKASTCTHTCPNCGCTTAIISGCLSIVVERERKEFLATIKSDWTSVEPMLWQPTTEQTHFICHVYVHQAKIRPGGEKKSVVDSHLRIMFAEQAGETYRAPGTLTPIWNTVITFKSLSLPGSVNLYAKNPPLLSLEFLTSEKIISDDFVGMGCVAASVIREDRATGSNWEDTGSHWWSTNPDKNLQKLKHLTPPPLKWVPISRKGSVQAEVLMSAELIEISQEASMQDVRKEPQLATGIPAAIKPNMQNFILEVFFVGLRNYNKSSMSSAGKRKIRVMMGDLVLTSGPSMARVRNTINFLVAYASGVVSLPDQQEYWPPIIATDVLLSGFNSESTLGAALIPNSTSFLQRDKTLRCVSSARRQTSSATSTTVTVTDVDEEKEEETEDEAELEWEEEGPPARITSWWRRLLLIMGLRTADYANRKALGHESNLNESESMDEREYTWWTKFYNSMYWSAAEMNHEHKHQLVIYPNELEKQSQFGYLQDWAIAVPLVHGVKFKKQAPPREDVYATLKMQFKLTPCQCSVLEDPEAGGDMIRPMANPLKQRDQAALRALQETMKLIVRVYIVQGIQIRPRDLKGDSDCYVKLYLGGKTYSDRANYSPNHSNPVFGRLFELEASLPGDHMLQIVVHDHDKIKDEIIGHTIIDLEDRWRTRHRATVGLPNEYSKSGYNHWHDKILPSEILLDLCKKKEIPPPYYYGNVIEVDGILFGDETVISKDEPMYERLSLAVLKNLDKLPSLGYKLVPEHVETRSLYRDDYPNVEQGKLQLWIELFEANIYVPNAIDITPVPPAYFEVRVVVKKLTGIQAGDRNIFGKLMSDIYVIGWCEDEDKEQSTDIHYRSFAGDAAFNWRMVFGMKYSPNEDLMVIRRKEGLREEIELKRPPIIYLQVWDNDVITQDEYLASLELNLSNLHVPYRNAQACKPFPKKRKRINLFKRKVISGWFPLEGNPYPAQPKREKVKTGKIQLQIEVCNDMEATTRPAGLGQDPPMALEAPYRPDTSFNPLTNPWKSFKHILWPAIRKYVLWSALVLAVVLGLVVTFSSLPAKLMGIPLK
ncbi:otoferlin isoform X2 [Drosophila serrata]|uniref:otoferlin isoform X2 n=1 Tax=Drosophila serrata TaxID=7274 RepID=UPI000A1D2A49|nr:otoferlin isoform X2 [Drosophila serrata]